MKKKYETDQESFWAGSFGDEYSKRNYGKEAIASNTRLFSNILEKCRKVDSVLEFGSNIGLNLHAINTLLPSSSISAIEINESAVEELKRLDFIDSIFNQSALDFSVDKTWDLTFVKGVLIHINPDFLPQFYDALYKHSNKYILVAEYYNPTPVQVNYRGNEDRLFKRDFAGELMDKYPDLTLLDYGFVWRRDPVFPDDDITWFLMQKDI